MQYVKAIAVKFVMMTFLLWIVLGNFFNVAFSHILFTSILLTGILFLVGDLFVLSEYENSVATMADFALSFFIIWGVGYFLYDQPLSLRFASLITALLIAFSEIFYHKYIARRQITYRSVPKLTVDPSQQLHTEISQEFHFKRG